VLHSWEVLASILSSDKTLDILCDIGMYVLSLIPPPERHSLSHTRTLHAQANNAQERDIQLSRDHP